MSEYRYNNYDNLLLFIELMLAHISTAVNLTLSGCPRCRNPAALGRYSCTNLVHWMGIVGFPSHAYPISPIHRPLFVLDPL